jgi:hypothetical protein
MKKITLLLMLMIVAFYTQAQSFDELQKIYAADGSSGSHFGWSISLGSNYLVVGQHGGYGGGAAYVFIKNNGTWIQLSKIRASDTDGNNEFGDCVSTDGEFILVGAPGKRVDGQNTGAAYFYKAGNGTWDEQEIIGELNDHFGSSVAIYGDYALIGADRTGFTNSHAFLFHYNGTVWEEVQELHNISTMWFGKSVALTGNMAVIADNTNIHLYNFSDDTLAYLTTLTYGSSGDEFGSTLCMSDDYIVAGSPRSDENGDDAGAVYVFHKLANMWVLNAQLVPESVKAGDRFGSSVALSGDYLVVGAERDYDEVDSLENKGAAYIYHVDESDNWELVQEISPSDADENTHFGCSATILDGEVFVGGYGGDGIDGSTGAAWYYSDPSVGIYEQKDIPLSLYPNPAHNVLYIETEHNTIDLLQVIDISGRTVILRKDLPERTTLDISALTEGLYLLSIQSGNTTTTRKFIKK